MTAFGHNGAPRVIHLCQAQNVHLKRRKLQAEEKRKKMREPACRQALARKPEGGPNDDGRCRRMGV
jgi:hypothetical protein